MADDVLDLGRLEEVFEDDREGIAELLELAMQTGAGYERNLHAAIDAHDIVAVARAAHSIKGSASNVGGTRVARLAAEMEERARDGSWDGIDEGTVAALGAAYDELRAAVKAYRATIAT